MSLKSNQEAEIKFLLDLLRATADCKGNAKAVYPVLSENEEKLNHNFIKMLRAWTEVSLTEINLKLNSNAASLSDMASLFDLIHNLCIVIYRFPSKEKDRKANNIEVSIAGLQLVLNKCNCDDFLGNWVAMQNGLGMLYADRVKGNKADNLETALAHVFSAQEVCTDEISYNGALTQLTLGSIYLVRVNGDKVNNIEKSIVALEKALLFFTRDKFPEEFTTAKTNLAVALQKSF